MSDHRPVAGRHHLLKDVPELVRSRPGTGFHQHHVLVVEKQVAPAHPLDEGRVHHVLRCEIELQSAFVGRFKLLETCFQALGGIRHILHGMRGEPHLAETLFLHILEYGKGLLQGTHAVIHAVQDVGMIVHGTVKDAAFD